MTLGERKIVNKRKNRSQIRELTFVEERDIGKLRKIRKSLKTTETVSKPLLVWCIQLGL